MRTYYLILFCTLSFTGVFSQSITREQLVTEFRQGRLIVFNGYALHSADPSFFRKLVSAEISDVEHLDSLIGRIEYGTVGKQGVVRLTIDNLNKLTKARFSVVDAFILKYFDAAKPMFYFIDGMPASDTFVALDWLVNKKIKEVQLLAPREAEAIWGRQGKDGAVMINTEGEIGW